MRVKSDNGGKWGGGGGGGGGGEVSPTFGPLD